MQQDEIIEMAKDVGFDVSKPNRIIVRHSNGSWVSIKFELEHFAKLVEERTAAKEREACAKVCESHGPTLANGAMLANEIRARGNKE